jgi:RNase adaptor protein for sRNA GlmZ degradation
MTRRIRAEAVHTKESRKAEQLAKLLTEDFSIDLERVGYYLVRNLPVIVFRRFDVLALSAQEEYDKLMEEVKGN